jgi:myo-inositol-1-phosphate synthase
MNDIKIAILGVGNCSSSLIQGFEYYKLQNSLDEIGLMHREIGGYSPQNIKVVAAFDIDRRKVGRPLEEAIFAKPNCTLVFQPEIPPTGVVVQMSPIMDGVAAHMKDYPEDETFCPADEPACDVTRVLRESEADVLVCYLPVGSKRAVHHYAEACLEAGVAMVNCVPVFIASDPQWASRFEAAGIAIIGDDIKSQVGATIVHRNMARLFNDRGYTIDRTYQLNTGGNTDFLNMLARDRLKSKKKSKTGSVQSQLDRPLEPGNIHIGPSDYVSWQDDNKTAFIRIEGRGFGGAPIELEMRLSVQDSPNSAGVVIDAIRCAQLATQRGLAGPVGSACAYYMKTPPAQMRDSQASEELEAFIAGPIADVTAHGSKRAAAE